MKKKIMREGRIYTHLIRRKPIEMSPDRRKAPQVHHRSTSNEPVFHGLMLKREGIVCKMIVCKKIDDSLQVDSLRDDSMRDDSLQDINTVMRW